MNQLMQNESNNPRTLPLKSKIILSAILIVAIIFTALIAFWFGKNFSTESHTTKLSFEDIGNLTTQEAYCTEVNVTDKSRDLFGITLPFTHSKYIYSYNVVVQAGFDFEKITCKEDPTQKVITVNLPKAKITACDIDEDSFKVYHEDESLFRKISLEENNTALKTLKAQAKKDAEANGILDKATNNAKALIRAFLGNTYDLDEYDVKFIEK